MLDNDLLGAILRTVKGVEVSDDTLSFDVIRDVVMGGAIILGHPQTFSRMKTDYLYPEIADRRSISEWEEAGARDARDVARDRVRKILAEHYPAPHPATRSIRSCATTTTSFCRKARMRAGNGVW